MFIFLYTVFRNSSISDEHVFCVALHFTIGHYILPFALIGIFLIGTFFHTDILLALVVVSLIYLYILVSQYKITKRYYKE